MAKEGSVAPKERINIKYVPATGGQQAEVELPLKLLVVGDYKGHGEDEALEDRKAININKNNFNEVMEGAGLSTTVNVKNRLVDDEDAEISVDLKFDTLQDFNPDAIVKQVPELKKLMELREALVALKGPIGNVPAFRAKIQELVEDEGMRKQLQDELDGVLSTDDETKQ